MLNNPQVLLDRLEQLEIESAFQQDLITNLNGTVTELQLELLKLREQLHLLMEKLKGERPNLLASPQEETPPPHY